VTTPPDRERPTRYPIGIRHTKLLPPVLDFLLLGCLLLAGCGGCGGCDGKNTIRTDDGLNRNYWVYTPADWDGETALPIVVGLHGGGGNAVGYRDSNEWARAADTHGFLAVFPEGTGNRALGRTFATWNAGICCGPAMEENVDDVGFIDAVLDEVIERYAVDTRRIYVTGHSNGSMMSFRLGCELSERIAAIGPYGALGAEDCTPSRPMPTFYTHGREDQCALYEGGECGGCFQLAMNELLGTDIEPSYWTCPAVPGYLDAWAAASGCTGAPETTLDEDGAVCVTRDTCGGSAVVTLCTLEGGGHAYPGVGIESCNNNPEGQTCEVMQRYVGPAHDFPLNERMWDFFTQHSLASAP